jgi:hypothetical protein
MSRTNRDVLVTHRPNRRGHIAGERAKHTLLGVHYTIDTALGRLDDHSLT